VADGGGDPVADGAGAALVAGGTEVAGLAGEGEEAFVAAVRALEAGEAGCEVAAAEEGFDGGRGGGVERAEGFAVFGFVFGEEYVPAVEDGFEALLDKLLGFGVSMEEVASSVMTKREENVQF